MDPPRRMYLSLKSLAFTLIVPGTAAFYAPLWLAGSTEVGGGWVRIVALLAVAAGAVGYLWCVWDFAAFGRGTPAPIDAPKRLVVRGLYRCTRNPMYVSVLTVISGWALFFRDPALVAYGVVLGTCFHAFVVVYEEPHLRGEFGQSYVDYCDRVCRWMPRPVRHGTRHST